MTNLKFYWYHLFNVSGATSFEGEAPFLELSPQLRKETSCWHFSSWDRQGTTNSRQTPSIYQPKVFERLPSIGRARFRVCLSGPLSLIVGAVVVKSAYSWSSVTVKNSSFYPCFGPHYVLDSYNHLNWYVFESNKIKLNYQSVD